MVVSCMDVIKTSAQPELARAFLNEEIAAEFQSHLAGSPWFFGPTNRTVQIPQSSAEYMPTTVDGLNSSIFLDWQKAVAHRGEVTEKFDREFSR